MMISVSGFNTFRQIDSLVSVLSESTKENQETDSRLHLNSILEFVNCHVSNTYFGDIGYQIVFSWSYCVVYSGSSFWVCGFINKKEGVIQRVNTPNSIIHQISCNQNQVICVMEDGGCWSYNIEQGQWKDLTKILNTEQCEEQYITEQVKKVCCGVTLTVALTKRGEIYNIPNKVSLAGVTIMDVACGHSHVLLLTERGEVLSFGEGSRGQLGHGDLEDEEDPCLVEGLAGLRVVAVACGGWHSCAITADGDLYTWGWNMAGQLGIKNEESSNKVSVQAIPQVVDWPGGEDIRVSKVACGSRHTLTLLDDGSVWGCGWNAYGQLALPTRDSIETMTKITTHSAFVKDIICGHWNSCLLT